MLLKDRLAQALAYRRSIASAGERVSQAAIAAACRISKPSVSDWFSGKTASIEGANLISAANYLKVRPEWLAHGTGAMLAAGDAASLGGVAAADPPLENTGPVVKWSLSPDEAAIIEAYRAQKAAAQRLKELTAIDADQVASTPVFPPAADTNVAPLPVRESGGPGGLRLTAAQKARQRGAPSKKTSHE